MTNRTFKKVILLEDRPSRQEQYLDQEEIIKLKGLEGLYMPISEECKKIISELNQKNDTSLSEFELILIHRSALEGAGIDTVFNYCKKKNKKLVFFSGGFGQSLFTSQDFPYLLLNSKDFYQPNMVSFLTRFIKEEIEHITELFYGDNWKLNLMLSYRQLLLKGQLGQFEEVMKESLEALIGKLSLEDLGEQITAKIRLL